MKAQPPATPADITPVIEDSWAALRRHTDARIALGRSGASLPTRAVLAFELAHAQARDAVLTALDVPALRRELEADGWKVAEVRSGAPDQAAYLARPDWGRRLHDDSLAALDAPGIGKADLVLVVSDGLSSTAVQQNAAPLLRALRPLLPEGLALAPVVIATHARVALADEVGERLGARIAVSLIGERPGLSSPDSLGAYLTYAPKVGRNDAERNCISNIRPQGLAYGEAALQLAALIRAMLQARLSGVKLQFDPARAIAADPH
ncbi:ethanolamine ammonia-lyase subunit EutC [Nevskia soli]|uniref:ethanolamine ammonia-lyase subunit EutC n=1 Tax=Nevskia soli TaxID=418856 RepID=UPI0004A770F2|nr:ethanolamine ammonia-lyase subunit EutC [Nevskia soli]